MQETTIRIFHTGEVCVAPALLFGGEHCSALKASGVFAKKFERLWLPVSAYLIEGEHGKVLFDCGWHREMSPRGVFDRRAQIGSLGSLPLYLTNQGLVGRGEAIDEQLAALGIAPEDLDLVLLSHLYCDHANGLSLVAGAKKLLVSEEELRFAENGSPVNRIRYCAKWWRGTKLAAFRWNGSDGPAGKSYDVFGDGSFVMVNIPGHAKGQCALKVTGRDGRFVLLYADGGYAKSRGKTPSFPALPTTGPNRKGRSGGYASRVSIKTASLRLQTTTPQYGRIPSCCDAGGIHLKNSREKARYVFCLRGDGALLFEKEG